MVAIGQTLGPYRVLEKIGEGGMGEVYQARDTKLDRDVALKVLPEAFTSDPDRLARFEREAKVLASLNHSNIGSIYGLEEAEPATPDGTSSGQAVRALVLELVEGPTLADRIKQGPIPVDEALPIARQIAEALEAAHEQGVIHRDLKPANIKVKEDGTVKVLDFGLAKAFQVDPGGDLSESPTVTAAAATHAGVILGTAAYMSPEQAKGKTADRRGDIWAFGCVLYEMLTGTRPFHGANTSEVLAAVIKSDPDWEALPDGTPSTLRQVVRRCLQKDPKQRLHDVADPRLAMDGAFETIGPPIVDDATAPVVAGFGGWRRVLAFVATTVVAGLVGGLGVWNLTRPAPPRVARFVLTALPSEAVQVSNGTTDLVISPDGTKVVYRAGASETALYVRAVDQLEGTHLRETSGGGAPFFAPNGNWVGFVSDGALRKVPVLGGPSVTICPLSSRLRGASWGADDTIIFAEEAHGGLFRVSAGGGDPEALTTLDEGQGEIAHRWPEILPGGQAVLFTIARGVRTEDRQIALLNLATGEQSPLVPLGSSPHYSPTGHIVYGVGDTLRAVSFDLDQLAVTGAPVPVLENVMAKSTEFGNVGPQDGAVNFSLARNGSLVYVSNVKQVPLRTLVWMDRQGQEEPLAVEPGNYAMVRISPDGTQLALDRRDRENDIWIWNIANETMTQLTFDPTPDFFPAWTPDGHLVFSSRREGTRAQLFVKAADGTGTAERLTDSQSDVGSSQESVQLQPGLMADKPRIVSDLRG